MSFLKYLDNQIFVEESDFRFLFSLLRAFSEYIIYTEMFRNGELEN